MGEGPCVLLVLVTRQNKGVDKQQCALLQDLPARLSFAAFIPCSSSLLCRAACLCVRLCCSHLLLFLYRDKSLINIKRTLAKEYKKEKKYKENFLNFESKTE